MGHGSVMRSSRGEDYGAHCCDDVVRGNAECRDDAGVGPAESLLVLQTRWAVKTRKALN